MPESTQETARRAQRWLDLHPRKARNPDREPIEDNPERLAVIIRAASRTLRAVDDET